MIICSVCLILYNYVRISFMGSVSSLFWGRPVMFPTTNVLKLVNKTNQATKQTNGKSNGNNTIVTNKPINQSTNQHPINQSTNQPINQSTSHQPINQSTNQHPIISYLPVSSKSICALASLVAEDDQLASDQTSQVSKLWIQHICFERMLVTTPST